MSDKFFIIFDICILSVFLGMFSITLRSKRFNFLVTSILSTVVTIGIIIFNIYYFKNATIDAFYQKYLITILVPHILLTFILSKANFLTKICFLLNCYLSLYAIRVVKFVAAQYIFKDQVIVQYLTLVYCPIIWLYVKYFYFLFQNEISETIPSVTPILFLYAVIIILIIFVYRYIAELVNQNILKVELFSGAVLGVYFISFSIFNILFRHYKIKMNELSTEEIFHKESMFVEERLQTYESSKNELRIIKHDLKHVLVTISQLLNHNQIDEALEYIQNYNQKIDSTVNTQNYSTNPIIDSVIAYYVNYCEKHSITLNLQLDEFEELINIPDVEFSVFISNCLENAVNATKKLSENKEINFSIINNKGRLVFRIKNSYNGKIKLDSNNLPISNRKNHGIGTTSIQWFVDKYHLDLNYEITKTHFTINILFNNSENK